MGRPTKLTPEVQARFVEAVELGCPVTTACLVAGIDHKTYRNWMLRGEKAAKGPYFQFLQAVVAAEGKAALALVGDVREAAKRDWKASAWLLRCRYPDEFGERREVVHSGGIAIGDKLAAIAESLKSGASESESEAEA